MEKLVSLVTPCYNCEKFLPAYFKSLLSQTYPQLELIFVCDGSTDGTERLIREAIPRFERRNVSAKLICQENRGLGGAVAAGIREVTGDYIAWADPDDILMPDSIAKRADFLSAHPEYGLVRSNGYVYMEGQSAPTGFIVNSKKDKKREEIFEPYVLFQSYFCPGCYMLRTSAFLQVNPDRIVYPSRFGQNIQLVAPVAYRYRCGYLDDPLYCYVVYENSMSRNGGVQTLERQIAQLDGLEDIDLHVLEQIGGGARSLIPNVKRFFAYRRFYFACRFHDRKKKEEYYRLLRETGRPGLKCAVMSRFEYSGALELLIRFCDRLAPPAGTRRAVRRQ